MNSSLDATEVEQVWTAGARLPLHVPAKTTSSSEIRYCLRIKQAEQKPRSDFFSPRVCTRYFWKMGL